MARMAAMATPGVRQPWLTSTLIPISGPTASRTAAIRATSSSGVGAIPDLDLDRAEPGRDMAGRRCRHRRRLAHADDARDCQRLPGAAAQQAARAGCRATGASEIVQGDIERGLGRGDAFDAGVEARAAPPRGRGHRGR